MDKIKVIAVDDHDIFLTGLVKCLEEYGQSIEIIATAHNEEELACKLKSGSIPDVILMDYNLQEKNGIEAAKSLKNNNLYRKIKVIILSAHKSYIVNSHCYEIIMEAIDAGMDGYIMKDARVEDIANAIDAVFQGKEFILGETINMKEINTVIIHDRKRLINFFRKESNFGLTAREIEVIQKLSEGLSSKEIANAMCISEDAITNHKDNIKLKLRERYGVELKNVVEMVVWAIRNKVIKL